MNDPAEIIVPVVALLCIFGLPIGAFVGFRVMKHRERMAMIAQGLSPDGPHGGAGERIAARIAQARPREDESAQTALRRGITLTAIGLALTIGLSFVGVKEIFDPLAGGQTTIWKPGPWLLGGLVPLFIGLARVAIALLSGATLRPMPGSHGGQPSAAPGTMPPPFVETPNATYEGPNAYRPGGTAELRSPSTPPERR